MKRTYFEFSGLDFIQTPLSNLICSVIVEEAHALSAFKDCPSSFSARPTDDLLLGIFVVN